MAEARQDFGEFQSELMLEKSARLCKNKKNLTLRNKKALQLASTSKDNPSTSSPKKTQTQQLILQTKDGQKQIIQASSSPSAKSNKRVQEKKVPPSPRAKRSKPISYKDSDSDDFLYLTIICQKIF